MTSGGNDFSDFPKNQLHSRQKNKLHLTKSGGGGSKARRALDFEKWGGSSLGALQKFTPMLLIIIIVIIVAQLAERRSLAGELTLSYARPAADG